MATDKPAFRGGVAAALHALHERFVAGETDPAELESTALRPVVADSWRRSLAEGVDPNQVARQASSDFADKREAHPRARCR